MPATTQRTYINAVVQVVLYLCQENHGPFGLGFGKIIFKIIKVKRINFKIIDLYLGIVLRK